METPVLLANDETVTALTEILDPDKLVEEHQAARMELGRTLRLDVGAPREMMEMANGDMEAVRDEYGLRLDTKLYARSSCKDCHGRGIVTKVVPLTTAQAMTMVAENPANEALLSTVTKKKGAHVHRAAHRVEMCGCARRRYEAKKKEWEGALVKAGLAKWEDDAKLGDTVVRRKLVLT